MGLSPDTLALLKQRGHNIAVNSSMGRTQTIQLRGGALYGYSDPRNPDGNPPGIDGWLARLPGHWAN